ncbi:hypothetical protein [Alkalihalobacillus pseudalcaliphilus]|uniref:hypothetical protein n=1 Tax=Alkalihalobacillus pseudalcaliphilus TaxID=79884 RepID=UPI00064D9BE4|nr:hypothetical protein [Alkalihalobacillus pseudalcaliphilus]KMK75909.1 hypothetical protein AB990_11685 [Alkalihalobacillus pseudalcaliphilus]
MSQNKEADFIFINDVVYIFSQKHIIESPKELEEIAIESEYHMENNSNTVSATKLQPGTKIFKSDNPDIIYVVKDDEYLLYEGIPEG